MKNRKIYLLRGLLVLLAAALVLAAALPGRPLSVRRRPPARWLRWLRHTRY